MSLANIGGLFKNIINGVRSGVNGACSGFISTGSLSNARPISTALARKPFTAAGANPCHSNQLLQPENPSTSALSTRTKISFNRHNGGPRNVRAVTHRFFRLANGMWIRTHAGRKKSHWKKTDRRAYRLQAHVFCTKSQMQLFDKMTSQYYKTPKFYVDDPYEHYHKKERIPLFRHLANKPKYLP